MTLEQITSALVRDGHHLGDLIWWTLAEARIDRSTLENIWAGAQLSSEHLPDPPTAEKALKAAVREAAIGQPDRLIRLGKENEGEIVFAVVRETKHPDGSVTYQQETRILLDRKAESVSSDICGFRPMPITDSGPSRSGIPVEADHRFRSKPPAERITSRGVIYEMARLGQLPGLIRLGRRVLFRRDRLLEFLLEREEQPVSSLGGKP